MNHPKICDGCGMVAERGPEQNLALHLVLFASGNEWTGERDEERERERERSITVRFWASGQRLIGERAFKWTFRIRFSTFTNVMSYKKPHRS